MWNYARFVALAMSASAGMLSSALAVVDRATAKDLLEAIERKAALPHLTYWIEPVETFGRMQRTSPARQPNDAALNASETREEA